jgi:hypothetical protein
MTRSGRAAAAPGAPTRPGTPARLQPPTPGGWHLGTPGWEIRNRRRCSWWPQPRSPAPPAPPPRPRAPPPSPPPAPPPPKRLPHHQPRRQVVWLMFQKALERRCDLDAAALAAFFDGLRLYYRRHCMCRVRSSQWTRSCGSASPPQANRT